MKKIKKLLSVLSVCGMMLFVTSCGKADKTLVLYSDDAYHYNIVCSTQITTEEAASIITLTDEMEELCGQVPTLLYESNVDADNNEPEILIGSLERSECELPELADKETYWCVSTKGKDIVINGSTSAALQVAMDYFMSQCVYDKEANTFSIPGGLFEESTSVGYYRDRWLLTDIPSYWGENEINGFVYDCGPIVTSKSAKEGSCLMQTVFETDSAEVKAYAELLVENGFEQIAYNKFENNEFYRFKNDTCKVSINYFSGENSVDIILDQTSVATTDVSYNYEPKAGERAEIYMYGLKHVNYDDPQRDMAVLGGLSMVIKCADNSVIIIDGGDMDQQFDMAAHGEFLSFLRNITGTAQGEKVRISAWYITHGHGDHANGMASFLQTNTGNVDLERVILNFPSADYVEVAAEIEANVKRAVQMYNCQEVKVHTGDVFTIADVTFEILYTHEDLINAGGAWGSKESNDASVVARLTTSEGMSLLMTGDMDVSSCAVLEQHFTGESMKSTFGLMAHHLYNAIPETWYASVDAQYYLAGQSAYNADQNSTTRAQVALGQKYGEKVYFGDDAYGFAYENGRAFLIYEKEMY